MHANIVTGAFISDCRVVGQTFFCEWLEVWLNCHSVVNLREPRSCFVMLYSRKTTCLTDHCMFNGEWVATSAVWWWILLRELHWAMEGRCQLLWFLVGRHCIHLNDVLDWQYNLPTEQKLVYMTFEWNSSEAYTQGACVVEASKVPSSLRLTSCIGVPFWEIVLLCQSSDHLLPTLSCPDVHVFQSPKVLCQFLDSQDLPPMLCLTLNFIGFLCNQIGVYIALASTFVIVQKLWGNYRIDDQVGNYRTYEFYKKQSGFSRCSNSSNAPSSICAHSSTSP